MNILFRTVFVIYALVLTVGTHWPALRLGQSVPITDKLIHALAFGGLTILLWSTRWTKNLGLIGVIMLIWAAGDELSQGLPILNRTMSLPDVLANMAGILLALAALWLIRRTSSNEPPERR